MTNQTITWQLEQRKVADLKGADYNPRKASEADERDLQRSIEEFGTVMPVVVNIGSRADVIIGGHFRVSIYKKQGLETIDVMVPSRELTIEEERRLNLRLNKNLGQWDHAKLQAMDLTLLLDVGFDDEEMQVIFDDVEMIDDEFNVARAVRRIENPKTKPGDTWILGDHLLMCGDSRDSQQVAFLMGKDLADVLWLDPPYNIGVNYGQGYGKKNRKQYRKETAPAPFKSDNKKDAKYAEFIDLTLKNALNHAKPNVHVFEWCDQKYIWLLQTLFNANKISTSRVCLWIKNKANPVPQVAFNKVYEPCVYGVIGKPFLNKAMRTANEVMNKEVEAGNQIHDEIMDIWLTGRDHETRYGHPTQKPVTLAERPLKRCTAPGQVVMDLFGGTGSIIIACEQIGRKARVMEMDPVFCDVIVQRWEEFTNKKAKRI